MTEGELLLVRLPLPDLVAADLVAVVEIEPVREELGQPVEEAVCVDVWHKEGLVLRDGHPLLVRDTVALPL